MHAFVRSRALGYLGEILAPEITRGEKVRVRGNWKGTPPASLDTAADLMVLLTESGPPASGDAVLVAGRVQSGGGRLSKIIEGRAPATAPSGAPLGFTAAPAARKV